MHVFDEFSLIILYFDQSYLNALKDIRYGRMCWSQNLLQCMKNQNINIKLITKMFALKCTQESNHTININDPYVTNS